LLIHEATEANASLMTWVGPRVRTVSLAFDDGRSMSANVPKQSWRSIVSIVLREAPAELNRLMTRSFRNKPGPMYSLPVCAETLSLLRLLDIVEGLDVRSAARVAEGWMQMPVLDRARGNITYQCRRVVHAQLLGLIETPSPVVMAKGPVQFNTFIKAVQYAGLSKVLGLFWRTADTVLGSSCMVFVSPLWYRLEAYLAISDCKVSYPLIGGGAQPEAHKAVQALIDHLPTVTADDNALRLAAWHPTGHEVMEIVDYLEDLKARIGDATP
jgi:hypothetical protein